LMRVFGSERIKTMMGRFGIPEDQPIENKFIGKQLESAQAKIEGFHFDARKNTLEYDDVMNHQRQSIYERRQIMMRAKKEEIEKFLEEILENREEKEKLEKIIAEKREKLGNEMFFDTVRRIALYTTDTLWMEHLEAMDYLRSSVNLRAYGQREPIVEYKKEGLLMFREMEQVFKEQVLSLIQTINTENIKNNENDKEEKIERNEILITGHNEPSEFSDVKNVGVSKDSELNIGRNDPCPCGAINPTTGQVYKYKKCGLINAPYHRKSLIN
jgi:preprotein translocase subunit SecA